MKYGIYWLTRSSCFELLSDGKYDLFCSQKLDWKMIFTWAFCAFHDILGLGKYGFSCSERLQVHMKAERIGNCGTQLLLYALFLETFWYMWAPRRLRIEYLKWTFAIYKTCQFIFRQGTINFQFVTFESIATHGAQHLMLSKISTTFQSTPTTIFVDSCLGFFLSFVLSSTFPSL